MNSVMESTMEEITLDDEDQSCMEYRVLMAFAQRNLSASSYHEFLKRSTTKVGDGKNGRTVLDMIGHGGGADRGPPPDSTLQSQGSKAEDSKLLKRKPSWKRLIPQCIRGEGWKKDDTGNKGRRLDIAKQKGQEHLEICFQCEEIQEVCLSDDAETETVVHIADHLVEIVHDTPHCSPETGFRMMRRSFSLEVDGGSDEDQIISGIVALLRESGDRLEEQIKEDKTLYKGITEVFSSYQYFKKLTDQYLGDLKTEGKTENKQQSIKVAFAMDVTTKLTAIDNHPMNKVLGFGVKYLKENFSPWIQDHGGWEKALGVTKQEEIE